MVGAWRFRRRFIAEHVHPRAGDRVLDVGCGTAELLELMPGVKYVGFDHNPRYIESACEKYGDRGEFHVADVREVSRKFQGCFDIILVIFVLHHLDDGQASELFNAASDMLAPGGRLITADPVLLPRQNPFARMLIRMDRGRHVRTEDGYLALAGRHFSAVKPAVHRNYLYVPYAHLILECDKKATNNNGTGE
jgi:2-polyprenyl-3-methyl-5-hydroxy-6-metoxy-1,4-benzoquinol methylase